MGRLLKLVTIVAGAVVVLLVAAALLIGFLFDPNDYKQEITAAVADATGRTLELPGDLELELFPSIRIAAGSASLSNAVGFEAPYFAQMDGASLRVALLPLLSGSIEVAEARLDGLRLNLERNAAGATNWEDIGAADGAGSTADEPGADAASADAAASPADFNLDIGAITIADAEVSWRDASTGTDWLLTDFGMTAAGFGLGAAFPLEIGFAFNGPDIEVSVEAETEATVDLATNSYRLDGLEVEIDGSGAAWPGGSGSATVAFSSFAANLDEQTLALEDLTLEMLGLSVAGTLSGEQLFDDLTLTGGIRIAEFDLNDLLTAFDTEIETADDTVFRRASASADFVYDARRMGMRNTRISLDDSTLTGSVGLEGAALKFDLNVDAINIDRYLPPSDDTASEDEGSVDEIDLPIDPLRDFVADGTLRLGQAQFMNMTFTDARFALSAGNGRLRLTPSGSLYGGTIAGEISIEVEGDAARFGLDQRLRGVDLLGLGRDFLGTEDISGTGDVTLDLFAVGSNVGALRHDLDGTAAFALSDGALEGIDAWHMIRRAYALFTRTEAPTREGPERTMFSMISASGAVEDGVLTTNDLNATLAFMSLDGAGTVNLLNDELDIEGTATLVDGPTLQTDPGLARYAGAQLPLTVSGTVSEPSVLPDFGKIVRAIVQQAVEDAVQEEIEARREEVQEEVEEEVRDRLRDRVRGLFDR